MSCVPFDASNIDMDHIGTTVNDVFPDEIWNRIFYAARGFRTDSDSASALNAIITVSKGWARLANPHLYHEIDIREAVPDNMTETDGWPRLRRLASSCVRFAIDDARRHWIRVFVLNGTIKTTDLAIIRRLQQVLADSLTVIFTRSCRLEEVSLSCSYGTQIGPIAALQMANHNTLTELDIGINNDNMLVLGLISQLSLLKSLKLRVCVRALALNVQENGFTAHPVLCLSNVYTFSWICATPREDSISSGEMHYLAQCRFNPICKIELDLIKLRFVETEKHILDPFFRWHHRSARVSLNIKGSFGFSRVLKSSRVLELLTCPPAKIFRDVSSLPELITLHFWKPAKDEVDVLLEMLHHLSNNPATFACRIRIVAEMGGGKTRSARWLWYQDPSDEGSDLEMYMTTKLLHLAVLLGPRGVSLADDDGNVLPFPISNSCDNQS